MRMTRGAMLFCGLLFLGPPAAAHSPEEVRKGPPPPVGADSAGLFFLSYPHASLQRNEQGTVHYRLTIERDGLPRDCVVTQSSGHERLDHISCAAAVQHGKFEPALNQAGRPIRSVYTGQVVWKTR